MALALRFDVSRAKQSQYFKSAFLGYTLGLVLTIVVMNWFQAAQVGNLVIAMPSYEKHIISLSALPDKLASCLFLFYLYLLKFAKIVLRIKHFCA